MGSDTAGISLTHELRRNFDGFAGLEVLEQDIGLEIRVEFLLVENLEQDNVLALPCQRPDSVKQPVDVAIKIRDHGDEAAPDDLLAKLVEGLVELRACARLGRVDAMQDTLQFAGPRRRRAVVANLFVKNHAADRVMLARCQVRETCCEELAVAQLGDRWAAEAHRCAGIE